ncbi:MAG: PIG-L deacetylase family protein [Chloroflexota bacterium]|nr:PIG-L deacetylase family protein [Chloroflexota bacterium]
MKLEQPLEQSVTILVIVAHPDDIEFGTAGSVARWTDAGHRVVYCIVTDGAAGSNDPNVTHDELVARRREEQMRAAACVGVEDVRFLGYADGTLQPTLELRRDLTRLIRELKPYRVVIMDPTAVMISNDTFDYINHPDHRATGEASLYAIFPSAETRPIFPELLAEGYEPHHVSEVYIGMADKANIAVDVTDVIERKVAALIAHESQLDASVGEMVRKWDEEAGKEIGVAYAETFRVMRFIREDNKPSPELVGEMATA